jgi:hypothetical protein
LELHMINLHKQRATYKFQNQKFTNVGFF